MHIHNVLTKKGGVGKSLVCVLLGCYFQERSQRTLNIDLDPNQPTFTRHKSLDVHRVSITRNGKVDSGLFDDALSLIYGAHDTTPRTDLDQVVIDSGAGSYLPFVEYMRREEVVGDFAALHYRHTLHVVLAGGQALDDCLSALDELITLFGEQSRVVVWLNDYFDALPWHGVDGFCESGAYRKHGHLIDGIIQMPDLDPETEGRAFTRFTGRNETFAEALASGEYRFSDSKRLMRIRRAYYDQLDLIFGDVGQSLTQLALGAE